MTRNRTPPAWARQLTTSFVTDGYGDSQGSGYGCSDTHGDHDRAGSGSGYGYGYGLSYNDGSGFAWSWGPDEPVGPQPITSHTK